MKEKQEIDFVITWVDDTDSEWQKEKAECRFRDENPCNLDNSYS